MLLINISHKYDPTIFIKNLKGAVCAREKKGKPPRKYRYDFYCHWALALLVCEICFGIILYSSRFATFCSFSRTNEILHRENMDFEVVARDSK